MAIRRASSSKLVNDTYRNALTDAGGDETWVRPSDWLSIPAASNSFHGLLAVHDNDANYVALIASGDYTVDWGDGSATENIASGVTAQHEYTYASLNSNTYCSRGYRQAIVTVTPQGGQTFTSINLNVRPSRWTNANGSTPWLDVEIDGAGLTGITIGQLTNLNNRILERVHIGENSVSTMDSLLKNCGSLRMITIFDTSQVTNMQSMFSYCHSLRKVPLFNTANVTTMGAMFYNCYSLRHVPIFDTSKVTSMNTMFNECRSLTEVPLFNTVNVTLMQYTFSNCKKLRNVPLLNTASVTNMSSMFEGCYSLKKVPLFNTSSVTSMNSMFFYCYSLTDVPLFNTSNVTNMAYMFGNCKLLKVVPLFNTASVTTMNSMFYECRTLQDVPALITTSVTSMSSMFNYCASLKEIPAMSASAATSSASYSSMFSNCESLSRIRMTGFKYSFSVASTRLDNVALDELYTNLATVTAQTITVTGCPGVDSDTPAIATGKGWTVTGS